MRCTISANSDPWFNLATEEFFLKNSDEEHFLIYINEPCIVVGKHQNLLSEINLPFVLNNNIKLARRISGGGTVFHDLNNLNFSFIHNSQNPDKINFARYTSPILEALRAMNLNVEFSERHDLLIDGKKISGNAMHIFKSRVLSHGTLLYNSDLRQLSDALQNNPQKYVDKSIKSVRSKVVNIAGYMDHPLPIDSFALDLFNKIVNKTIHSHVKALSDKEVTDIQQIAELRYETWEWIYGYSPKYLFQNSIKLADLTLKFEMLVEKGVIKSISVNTTQQSDPIYATALNLLINVKHDYHEIKRLFETNPIIKLQPNFNIPEFCTHLF